VPATSPVSILAGEQTVVSVHDAETVAVCGDGIAANVGLLCPWVLDLTGNEQLARGASTFITVPLRLLLILLVALLLRFLAHRAIARIVRKAAYGRNGNGAKLSIPIRTRGSRTARVLEAAPLLSERREQRAQTIGSVLRSIVSLVVFGVALTMMLSELGFDLAPVIASAGIIGIAVGFGAQNLVRDFLSGIFMILEDQYGVGDIIDAGEASGTVEAVALRTTRLRDVEGVVWHIRNGEILRVGNKSQGWSRALIDVPVAYDADVGRVSEVIKAVADGVWQDPQYSEMVLDEPDLWGLERFDADSLALRLVVKTAPLQQWKVGRVLRRRIKEAFDAEGIEIPFPQRSIWIRTEGAADSPQDRVPTGRRAPGI
jgi:moderate conductance mechanosensitive channel